MKIPLSNPDITELEKEKVLKGEGISQPGHATMEEFKGNY